jgi:hypothetical protein
MSKNPNAWAFSLRNDPALPADTLSSLTQAGTGVLDWNLGLSWDASEASKDHKGAAKRSLEVLKHLNEVGGYGVIHTEQWNDFVVGRVDPGCVRLQKLNSTNDGNRYFKLFELDEYAVIDVNQEYQEVRNFAHNNLGRETLTSVEHSSDLEVSPRVILKAYRELDMMDRL